MLPGGLQRPRRQMSCTLRSLLFFYAALLLGALEFFCTLTLPTLAYMSNFPTFSYLIIAYKKVKKGLEIGNSPKGSKT